MPTRRFSDNLWRWQVLRHALERPDQVQLLLGDVATTVDEGGHDSSPAFFAQSFGLGYSKARLVAFCGVWVNGARCVLHQMIPKHTIQQFRPDLYT